MDDEEYFAILFRFYQVNSKDELIKKMDAHISRLQNKMMQISPRLKEAKEFLPLRIG